eukprot:1507231-Alexandrium_andersonii.AAC.1
MRTSLIPDLNSQEIFPVSIIPTLPLEAPRFAWRLQRLGWKWGWGDLLVFEAGENALFTLFARSACSALKFSHLKAGNG